MKLDMFRWGLSVRRKLSSSFWKKVFSWSEVAISSAATKEVRFKTEIFWHRLSLLYQHFLQKMTGDVSSGRHLSQKTGYKFSGSWPKQLSHGLDFAESRRNLSPAGRLQMASVVSLQHKYSRAVL
jgi:hypothetical protein